MTSHQVAIAKASFSAGLLRPDPKSVPRDEITSFHDALDRMLGHCSPANVQTCKFWLLENVIPSAKRVGVLGKYLAALGASYQSGDQPQPQNGNSKPHNASSKRKRLHALYLLNDILHHTKYHGDNPSAFSTLSSALQPYLVELFDQVAGYDQRKNPKHFGRIAEILDIWVSNGYYSQEYVEKLRQTVEQAASPDAIKAKLSMRDDTAAAAAEKDKVTVSKDLPYVMPATHGDPNALWHELPAGNLMPLIVPNSSSPIRSQSVKPLQFLAGPADETLVKAVKNLLNDTDRIYNTSGGILDGETLVDVDELGQLIVRNEATGIINEGDGYYGWSRPFCQKMKERQDGKSRSRSSSRSRSRSRSSSPRKRRRYSVTGSEDEDRGTHLKSRVSPPRRASRRGRSISRSRSPGPRRSPSRSRSYSPRPPSPQNIPHPGQHRQPPAYTAPPPPPPQVPYQYQSPSAQPHFSPPPPAGSPGAFPSPPPRPPNYNGPWPPPPPPMPPQHFSHSQPYSQNPNMSMNTNIGSGMGVPMNMNMKAAGYGSQFTPQHSGQNFMSSQVPPPPPPPPPPQQPPHATGAFPYPPAHHGHQGPQPYGRGGRGSGRGGWGGGGWS